MSRAKIIILIYIFFIMNSCNFLEKELLIDSFEGILNNETVDYGASSGSFVNVSADRAFKICGKQSLKLDYELKPQGYMWVARGYNLDVKGADKWLVMPQDIDFKKYNAFSFYIYGNKSGGIIAFDIKDKNAEIWRFIIDDNFSGWKEIICPFSNFFPRKDWQPNNAKVDDILDFPILSFQFEPRTPSKGTYYFDCVKLVNRKIK